MSDSQKRLLQIIQKSGLSYSEIEKLSGVSRSSIQRYASGVTKEIPAPKLRALAEALHADVLWLMGIDGETVAEEDRDVISALTPNLKRKLDIPENVQALNTLLYEYGFIIERTEDGYYAAEIGPLSDDDLQFLLDTAVGSLRPAVEMLKKRAERDLRRRLAGEKDVVT